MCLILGTIVRFVVNIPKKIYKIIMMNAQAGIDPPITSYSSVRNSKYLSKKTLAQGKVNILTNVSLRLIFIKL